MTVNFPLETTETRKKWDSIFQLKRTVNPEIYIQQKHLSKMKGERRHFQVKKKKSQDWHQLTSPKRMNLEA